MIQMIFYVVCSGLVAVAVYILSLLSVNKATFGLPEYALIIPFWLVSPLCVAAAMVVMEKQRRGDFDEPGTIQHSKDDLLAVSEHSSDETDGSTLSNETMKNLVVHRFGNQVPEILPEFDDDDEYCTIHPISYHILYAISLISDILWAIFYYRGQYLATVILSIIRVINIAFITMSFPCVQSRTLGFLIFPVLWSVYVMVADMGQF